jgi:hypothetical protein
MTRFTSLFALLAPSLARARSAGKPNPLKNVYYGEQHLCTR